jgi:4-amino-4-deoxy-L-arabinose transferase-like glycosyltransferase
MSKRRDAHWVRGVPGAAYGLLVVTALAVAARWYGIGKESVWLDEATSLMLARMSLLELVKTTSLDVHPPLYYILLHFWIALGTSEAVIRGLSAVAGVLNVVVLFGLGRELFGVRTGLIAALLLAVAPFHVWYSQETRMYTWVTLLSTASILLAFRFWRGWRWLAWMGYVLVTAAALYTHYYAVFTILLEDLFFAYLLLRRRANARLVWGWLTAQVGVFLLFVPWLPMFLVPMTTGGEGWVTFGMGKPTLAALAQTAVLYVVGSARGQYPALVRRAGYVLFAVAFVAGIWPCAWGRLSAGRGREQTPHAAKEAAGARGALYNEGEAVGFVLAYLVVPLGMAWAASQVLKPMYSARYMLPFLVPFILLVARGVARVRWGQVRALVLAAMLVVMGVGVWAQERTPDKPDWRAYSAKVIQLAQKDDLVLFMPGWHAKAFDYYAQGRLTLFSDVPIPVDRFGDQALQVVAKAIQGHPRVWFVWETGHYTDRDGAVYAYLQSHCRQASEMQMPLLGRIILFENPGTAGGS